MAEETQSGQRSPGTGLIQAIKIAREAAVEQTANGVRYAEYGQNQIAPGELVRIVQAVPLSIAAALGQKIYYFVPLAMTGNLGEEDYRGHAEDIMISPVYIPELIDDAVCHRNVTLGSSDGIFISTRLLDDRFALAFEFFINVGHAFVESAGVPQAFQQLAWDQALKEVRGETSQDAWEARGQSLVRARIGTAVNPDAPARIHIDEKAKSEYLEAAFADAVAIYLLSLSIDFNYSELREREYPLLAAQPLAERLRLIAKLFPPNPGYEFAIRYRRRA